MNRSRLFKLPEKLRGELARPLGILIPNEQISKEEIQKHIGDPEMLVTVGDATTDRLLSFGITPSIQIIDGREMRLERIHPSKAHTVQLHTANPPGHISTDSIKAILSAIDAEKPVRILVEGEEDLLTLPILAFSPLGTVVLYGQPKTGLVVIKADERGKQLATNILQKMGIDVKNFST